MDCPIEVVDLRKRYGPTNALDGISLEIGRGEIFGVVGPNGAGKTTLVECITGLREADGGRLRVLGLDPAREGRRLRERIGIQLQRASLPSRLKVGEALRLYASFYARPVPWLPLLERWGLAEKIDAPFEGLSGGQQQRLFVTLALINDPEIVVLDELTAGLDPQARRASWDLVDRIREGGTTVLVVTHFMEEAERLCDRVAVVDRGQVVALGRPTELHSGSRTGSRVRFTPPPGFDATVLRAVPGVGEVVVDGREVVIAGNGFLMAAVAGALAARGVDPPDLRTERATLEDVFLDLTGSAVRA